MKLRNKKTGDIIESEYMMLVQITSNKGERDLLFEDLAQFNEEWEDYKPTDPLIKDEEVRAMVRIWAKQYNSSKLLYLKLDGQDGHYLLDRKALRSIDVDVDTLKIHEVYTITELCGEETE